MKKIILSIVILIIGISSNGIACCGFINIKNAYFNADVVLVGKVNRVFDKERQKYKINIIIDKVFRGDSINEFVIFSTPENYFEISDGDTIRYFSSVDIFLRKNETWVIFANKDSNGVYSTNACKLTKKLSKFREYEIDFLKSKPNINDIVFSFNEISFPYIAIEAEDFILDDNVIISDSIIIDKVECRIVIDTIGQIIEFKANEVNSKGIEKKIYNFLKSKEPYSIGTFKGRKVKTERWIEVNSK